MQMNLNYLINDVQSIVKKSTAVKLNFFKSWLKSDKIDRILIDRYLEDNLSFLNRWNNVGKDAEDLIKSLKPDNDTKNIKVIPYDDVVPYLFNNYDYASILQFADGVIKGINSKKIKFAKDVNDFREFVINKAFKNQPLTYTDLLAGPSECLSNAIEVNSMEIAHFKSIKNRRFFDQKEYNEIYKSIDAIIHFLQGSLGNNEEFDKTEYTPELKVAFVNNTIDFIIYIDTLFAIKNFIIAKYAEAYNYHSEVVAPLVIESTEFKSEITIMQDCDEIYCHNAEDVEKLLEKINEFASAVGADEFLDPSIADKISYCNLYGNHKILYQTKIGQELVSNPLLSVFMDGSEYSRIGSENGDKYAGAQIRWNEDLKEYLNSNKQYLSDKFTYKQHFLQVIKNIKPNSETVKGYAELVNDIRILSFGYLSALCKKYLWSLEDYKYQAPQYVRIVNIAKENVKMLVSWYTELSTVILFKLRSIERVINQLKNAETLEIVDQLTIKVPGEKKEIKDDKENILPDTERMPIDLASMYSQPAFEAMMLYDEYVKTLPGFSDMLYYNEAFSVNSLINTLSTALDGIMNNIRRWFNNQSFKNAKKWCEEHQEELRNATFNGTMDVYPYKKDVNLAYINQLPEAMGAFNETTLSSEESVNTYVLGLYSKNKDLMDIFDNLSKKETTSEQRKIFENKIRANIMIGKALNDNTDIAKKALADSNAIKNELIEIWLDNIIGADGTLNALDTAYNKIKTADNNFKSKVTTISQKLDTQDSTSTSTTSTAANQTTPAQNNDQNNDNKDGQETTTNTQSSNPTAGEDQNNTANSNNNSNNNDKANLLTKAITATTLAKKNIWLQSYNAITASIFEMYKYVQQAYSLIQK